MEKRDPAMTHFNPSNLVMIQLESIQPLEARDRPGHPKTTCVKPSHKVFAFQFEPWSYAEYGKLAGGAMKHLILLLDGTWNDADTGPCDSNIVRLRDIIDRSLDTGLEPRASGSQRQSLTTSRSFQGDDVEHLVFYERGVGTGPLFDMVGGGAFGDGLSDNIRCAYKFLSFHYQPDDLIFIFGFSRGAYTARSLAGYIHDAGLLMRDACTPDLEAQAWAYYRTPAHDRQPGTWSQLTPHVFDRTLLTIECLGVFDTVGALGIPLTFFLSANRQRYGFHDVNLNPIVRINLQALAIDEHRAPFEAAVWRKMPFK